MNRRAAAWRLVGIGWYIGICIAGGVFIGRWLDSKLHTGPILVIIGLVVGCLAAFLGVYFLLMPAKDDNQNKEK